MHCTLQETEVIPPTGETPETFLVLTIPTALGAWMIEFGSRGYLESVSHLMPTPAVRYHNATVDDRLLRMVLRESLSVERMRLCIRSLEPPWSEHVLTARYYLGEAEQVLYGIVRSLLPRRQ